MITDGSVATRLLAEALSPARRVLVFTGAGISTASGIPDFRGPDGVWTTRRPVGYGDFMRSPDARIEYWRQKLEDRNAFGEAAPNAVHAAIVRLETAGRVEMVVTQNVDGLHRAAGTSADRLVELHGTTAAVECQSCLERSDPAAHFDAFAATGTAPACHCGGYLKPATISFGQPLRSAELARAVDAAAACDLVVVLGSTLVVEPAASIPLLGARGAVPYVIVNRGATSHDDRPELTLRIDADVGAVVPAAVARVLGRGAAG